MNLSNPIEIPLKREAKRMGYTLRYIPDTDPWHPSMGPYYLVNRQKDIGRVRYQGLTLNEVFGVLSSLNVPPSAGGRVRRLSQ